MRKVTDALAILGGLTAFAVWCIIGYVEMTGWSDKNDKESHEALKVLIRESIQTELLESKTGGVVRAK
tara:strand:+ start:3352 stop:3555 length:204 start_codon:yes stop_codon:yes gene_type:complete